MKKAAEDVLSRMLSDTMARPTVLQLYEAVQGPALGRRARLDDAAIFRTIHTRLRQAFQVCELCLCREAPRVGAGGSLEEQAARAPASPPPRESRQKTWIGVRLVDVEGNPVANKHYLKGKKVLKDSTTGNTTLAGESRILLGHAHGHSARNAGSPGRQLPARRPQPGFS